MKNLTIGNLIAKRPIIQGGMGVGISLSNLASAIANEGGIGVISSVGIGLFENDSVTNFVEATRRALVKNIREARKNSKGIIGVNAMVALNSFDELVKIAIDENIDIIFAGAGLPLHLPKFLKPESNTKLVPIISSARAAAILCDKWQQNYNYLPDAFVIEGPKAGGHLGFKREQIADDSYSLDKLFKEVKTIVTEFENKYIKKIPIIVAGGIYTGADIYKFLEMGADGVQMGTKFVTSIECDASDEFKNAYINCKEEDIRIIQSPVGMPGRAIWNNFLDKVESGQKRPINCIKDCLRTCDYKIAPYCIVVALMNAAKGKMQAGFAFAGANAYRADKISTVKEIFNELISEFEAETLRFAL